MFGLLCLLAVLLCVFALGLIIGATVVRDLLDDRALRRMPISFGGTAERAVPSRSERRARARARRQLARDRARGGAR